MCLYCLTIMNALEVMGELLGHWWWHRERKRVHPGYMDSSPSEIRNLYSRLTGLVDVTGFSANQEEIRRKDGQWIPYFSHGSGQSSVRREGRLLAYRLRVQSTTHGGGRSVQQLGTWHPQSGRWERSVLLCQSFSFSSSSRLQPVEWRHTRSG